MTELRVPQDVHPPIEASHFRKVLGTVPTGVAVITTRLADGTPLGMTVGTFSSVSLDPPLVGFMATRGSRTWAAIRDVGSFCANVLSDQQEDECRTFAGRAEDKFHGFAWRESGTGSPILDGVVAWVDCDIEAVHEAGDHDIVIGRVRELQPGAEALPLVFLGGAYGRVGLRSFAAWHEDLLQPLRLADLSRGHIESLSARLGRECIITAAVQQELVLLASSGTPEGAGLTRVGQRIPFIPPFGSLFVAWAGEPAVQAWRARVPEALPGSVHEDLLNMLDRVRSRGFTAGTGRSVHVNAEDLLSRSSIEHRRSVRRMSYETWQVLSAGIDPPLLDQRQGREVRSIAVPVFDAAGSVVLSLGVHRLPPTLTATQLDGLVKTLTTTAAEISAALAR